ncbi:MAG: hypothetical protein ACQEXQ_21870 [Bacillota bacterium]
MKKIFFLIITIGIFFVGCSQQGGPYKSATSTIIVIEKNYSEDYKEAWIMAYDPNNSARDKAIKIVVEEPMVWNLIEKEQEYFASYHKKGEKPWILKQVEHPSDDNTLR